MRAIISKVLTGSMIAGASLAVSSPPSPNASDLFEPQEPIYPEDYEETGRSVKRSHRAEGRNFID